MGLAYVAPIGMQNMYVINSSINFDRKNLIITVFSIIANDISLALVCFLGFGYLLSMSPQIQPIMTVIGFIALVIISFNIWRSTPSESNDVIEMKPLKIILAAIVVTWLNPQAILDGTIILGSMHATLNYSDRIYFILGFISASTIWFSSLSLLIRKTSNYMSKKFQLIINKVSAIILFLFGLRLIMSLL